MQAKTSDFVGERCLAIKPFANLAGYLALACVIAVSSAAQQDATPAGSGSPTPAKSQDASRNGSTSSSQTPTQDQGDKDEDKKPKTPTPAGTGKVEGTSNDRLFYTLPNFLTLQNTSKLPPLSAKDKFKVVALGSFDYVEYPWWGVLAAISQAENSEPAFGQGWASYGKRYGTQAADSTIENFMVGAVFPSILHQDPRFYQSPQGGFTRRTIYAVSRIFVTRSDAAKNQFNFSEVFGAATAAGISAFSYHPRGTYLSTPTNPHMFVASDRTIGNAVDVWGTQLTLDTITIVVKEFWPDIHRKLSHKATSTTIDNTSSPSAPHTISELESKF